MTSLSKHMSGESVTWGTLVVSMLDCLFQSVLAQPRIHLKRGPAKVKDVSSNPCGYAISGWRTRKKLYGTSQWKYSSISSSGVSQRLFAGLIMKLVFLLAQLTG